MIPLSSMISSLPCGPRGIPSASTLADLAQRRQRKETHSRDRDALDVPANALYALALPALGVPDAAEDLDGLARDELERDARVRLEERRRAAQARVGDVVREAVRGVDDGLRKREGSGSWSAGTHLKKRDQGGTE